MSTSGYDILRKMVDQATSMKIEGYSNAEIAQHMGISEKYARGLIRRDRLPNDVVPLSLMSKYLGQEVNVILKDGTSLWRPLTGVKTAHIELDDNGIWLPQNSIRSFGTRDEGILMEVSQIVT